jgi:putative transposase
MPRPPRADEAGGLYHALNRGNLRATPESKGSGLFEWRSDWFTIRVFFFAET